MERHVETVRKWIGEHRLLSEGGSVLVGLSGGLDSTVLADILFRLEYAVHVIHVNYRLRGEASDGDEAFVRAWCAERLLPLEVRSFDTAGEAAAGGESVQEAARRLRYGTFAEAASAAGIGTVAVGHHRDDQVETVLINLFRGTGPEGLAGMRTRRRLSPDGDIQLIRPLLALWRQDIEEYARTTGLTWREDATNLSSAYRRGALRTHVLPQIEKFFGNAVKANVARSADLVRAYVDGDLRADFEAAFAKASSDASEERTLDVTVLRSLDAVLARRVILEGIRRWLPDLRSSSAIAREVENLLEAQIGRRFVHPSGEVWRERTHLLFRSYATARMEEESAVRLTADAAVETPLGVISVKMDVDRPDDLASGSPDVEFVDADRIEGPLMVRPWRMGDRFVPLGMRVEKKLSDFLTDEKVPAHRKREIHVVQKGEDIVWVVGHRIAHTVRVRPETSRIAQLRFRPAENSSSESA